MAAIFSDNIYLRKMAAIIPDYIYFGKMAAIISDNIFLSKMSGAFRQCATIKSCLQGLEFRERETPEILVTQIFACRVQMGSSFQRTKYSTGCPKKICFRIVA